MSGGSEFGFIDSIIARESNASARNALIKIKLYMQVAEKIANSEEKSNNYASIAMCGITVEMLTKLLLEKDEALNSARERWLEERWIEEKNKKKNEEDKRKVRKPSPDSLTSDFVWNKSEFFKKMEGDEGRRDNFIELFHLKGAYNSAKHTIDDWKKEMPEEILGLLKEDLSSEEPDKDSSSGKNYFVPVPAGKTSLNRYVYKDEKTGERKKAENRLQLVPKRFIESEGVTQENSLKCYRVVWKFMQYVFEYCHYPTIELKIFKTPERYDFVPGRDIAELKENLSLQSGVINQISSQVQSFDMAKSKEIKELNESIGLLSGVLTHFVEKFNEYLSKNNTNTKPRSEFESKATPETNGANEPKSNLINDYDNVLGVAREKIDHNGLNESAINNTQKKSVLDYRGIDNIVQDSHIGKQINVPERVDEKSSDIISGSKGQRKSQSQEVNAERDWFDLTIGHFMNPKINFTTNLFLFAAFFFTKTDLGLPLWGRIIVIILVSVLTITLAVELGELHYIVASKKEKTYKIIGYVLIPITAIGAVATAFEVGWNYVVNPSFQLPFYFICMIDCCIIHKAELRNKRAWSLVVMAVLTIVALAALVINIHGNNIKMLASADADINAFGPERKTYTMENVATEPVFNSITNNPTIGDERAFVRIGEITKDSTDLTDSAEAIKGKKYLVYIYVHNNASSAFNDSEHEHKGVALNTRVSTSFPEVLKAGETGIINAIITSDNSKPKSIWSSVAITSKEQNVSIKYIDGSAKIYNDWELNGTVMSDALFEDDGALLGLNNFNGVVPGGEEYHCVVSYMIEVE